MCGKDFYVSKKSSQKLCSIECQHKWQCGNTGFNNPKFEGGYIKCENCGQEFLVGGYRLRQNQHHFCSTECRRDWYSNVWSQTSEWKDESRKRAATQLSAAHPLRLTKPQLAVNRILELMEVAYRNEEPFVYYAIDNYLPDSDLAIEVMGDYWHSSPLKYLNHLSPKQRRIVARDKAKRTFIKQYYNIDILYIWETDVLKNPSLCQMLISKYIDSGGVLPNYNSFNYFINNNGQLCLNDNLIYSYQENNRQLMS